MHPQARTAGRRGSLKARESRRRHPRRPRPTGVGSGWPPGNPLGTPQPAAYVGKRAIAPALTGNPVGTLADASLQLASTKA
eukprot:scaffold3540_cov379-Prasinococcus_capsulatus_cf.AAC.3